MEEAATATATRGMTAVRLPPLRFLKLSSWLLKSFRNFQSRVLLQESQGSHTITTSGVGPPMVGLGMGERTLGAEIIATIIHPSAQRIQVMEEAVTATATRGMTAVRLPPLKLLNLNPWFRKSFRNQGSLCK